MAIKTFDTLNQFLKISQRRKSLTVILTHKCNLHCAYCLRGAGSNEKKKIPYRTLKKIIVAVHRFGVRNTGITGGEAFLYSHWKELVKLLGELKWRVSWETNGFLVNGKILGFMKKNLGNNISFLVSLDSHKKEIHDKLRGNGSFKKALRAIKLIKSRGLRLETNVVLTPLNMMDEKDLVAYMKFVKKLGAGTACFNRIVNLGRGTNQESFGLSDKKIAELGRLFKKYDYFKDYINVRDGICRSIEDDNGCERLGSEICVSPIGIHPCVFHEDIKLGELKDFSKIFLNQQFFKTLNILRMASMADSRGKYFSCAGCVEYLAGYLKNVKELELADDIKTKKAEQTSEEKIINDIILPSGFSVLMTQKCNLNCDFCEFDSSPDKTAEINIADFEKLLDEGRKIGISEIVFDGGEPLVHSRIKEAMRLCARYGYDVTVLTNGWHFQKYLPEFKKYNIKKFIFGINGATAKTNDAIMGKKGVLKRAIKAIKLSKKLGFFTGLHIVVHPLNIGELDKFFKLAKKWKVDYIMVSRISEGGRAKDNPAVRITPEQIEEVRKIYWKNRNFLRKIKFYPAFIAEGRSLGCDYLNRTGRLSVHWGGEIALCSMVPLLNLPFKKISNHYLLECLGTMNEVNQKFQKDRDKEYPNWRLTENPYFGCEYCHERLIQNRQKYFKN